MGIDAHYVICGDINTVGLVALETLLGDVHLVVAWRHGGDGINAAVVGDHGTRVVGLGVGDHDLRVRNRCAGVICNRADNRTVQCLRLGLEGE